MGARKQSRLDMKLVTSWISYQCRENDLDWWAVEDLMDLARDKPDEAFRLLKMIVSNTDKVEVLGIAGASTLEDILHGKSGNRFADDVIQNAQNDWRWRLVLGNVWTHGFENRELAGLLEESKAELWPDGCP